MKLTSKIALFLVVMMLASVGTGFATEETPDRITETPVTLSCWVPLDAKVSMSKKSHAEIAMYQEAEKLTGVSIEWIHPSANQVEEQFNLMLASGDLPDIMIYNWPVVPGGPAKMIKDGVILDLTSYMDQYAPNLTKLYAEHPDWKKQAVLDDGSQYMFPFIRADLFVTLGSGFQLRNDWLEKLGLKVPTTIDECYQVLKAFKEQDPNGNGEADEIPFTPIDRWGINNFAYSFGVSTNFQNNNGTVKYGPLESNYRVWLETMAKWYAEGLINPEYLTVDMNKADELITGNRAGSYFGMLSGSMGKYLDMVRPTDPTFDLVASPTLKGPDGKGYSYLAPEGPQTYGASAVSANCPNKEIAIQWLDFFFSEQEQMLGNYGVEGVSYTMVDGKPVFTDKVLHDEDGLPVTSALCKYNLLPTSSYSGLFRGDAWEQVLTYPEQVEAIKTWEESYDPSIVMPKTSLTADEAKKNANLMGDIAKYTEEVTNKIIMGMEPIEKYDEMVQNLEKMKIGEAIAIQQAALDRYNQR